MKRLAILLPLLSANALSDYQMELEGAVLHTEEDSRLRRDYTNGERRYRDGYQGWGVSGTYYFQPVATQSVPLSDAAFLQRASRASVGLLKIDSDEHDSSLIGVEAVWILDSGVILGATYLEGEEKYDYAEFTVKGPGAKLGYYLGASSSVEFDYQLTDYQEKYPFSSYYDLTLSDREIYTLTYKNVIMEGDKAHSDVELVLTKDFESVKLESSVGLFVGNSFKYGISAGVVDYDYALDVRSYSFWLEKFFSENIAVAASLTVQKSKEETGVRDYYRYSEQTVGINAKFRF